MNRKVLLTVFLAILLVVITAFCTKSIVESKNQKEAEEIIDIVENVETYEDKYVNVARKELLLNFDYGDEITYVVGHRSPDPDTICSSIAMANLLNEIGINAEAVLSSNPNKVINYIVETYNLKMPDVLEDAEDKQLWLVDHSTYAQTVVGADKARIVGVVDHHGLGGVVNNEQINVISAPVGSTCSIVYSLYKECGVDIGEQMAGVLLTGLLDDTSNMSNSVTQLDKDAFEELNSIVGIADTEAYSKNVSSIKNDFTGMSDYDIYYHDYKGCTCNGVNYGVAIVKAPTIEETKALFDKQKEFIKEEIKNRDDVSFLIIEAHDADYTRSYVAVASKNDISTAQIMELAFGDLGTKEGDYWVFEPSINRKKTLIPNVDEAIKELTNQ